MRDLLLLSLLILGAAAPPVVGQDAAGVVSDAEQPLSALPYRPALDLTSMDRSVDPCADFYAYSCGGWVKSNPIPADHSAWSVYSRLQVENEELLWGILKEAAESRPEAAPLQRMLGDYFAACMDEEAVERAGAAPLTRDLEAIAGLKTVEQMATVLGPLQVTSEGNDMLFGFGADQDPKDSSQVIAFATAGGLGLPDRDYYTRDDDKSRAIREKYVAHVQRVLELLGETPEAAAADAATVMRIETSLAKASLTAVEKRDPYKTYHKMRRSELQALTPGFNWGGYLVGVGVDNLQTLNVTEPEFYKELGRLLQTEPIDAWRGYLRWHLVESRAPYLSATFVRADFDFYRSYLRGVPEMRPRWKRCVEYADRDIGEALGQAFVERVFPPELKQGTQAMVKEIESAMEARLRELPWMGRATKQQALAKLDAMKNKIGYPDKWRDYSALGLSRGDFLGNVTRAVAFESRRQLGKIGRPVDRGEWGMTPPTVNAYYNASMNDMNFPAGILLPPLYDPKLDAAPNYGNTGSTIGHELTHGFDDEGRQFDAQGNLRDWWTADDAKEFEARASCVADQYAQYVVVDDIKINSRLTLGEDVADLGGTILAYLAWKDATKGEALQPSDGLTPDQRFFVGFAQWACANERPEILRLNAITNPHSPARYRVNGVVVNIPEFAQAFSCKPGQPMVKASPCRIW